MARPEALVEFTRELRHAGLPVGPTTASDLMTALELVGAGSGDDVYHAFRHLTVAAREQIPVFDAVFTRFFGNRPGGVVMEAPARARTWSIAAGAGEGDEGDSGEETPAQAGASAVVRLANRDFAELSPDEAEQVRSLIDRMLWTPAEVWSRRRQPARYGDRPDLRRTFRRMVGPEGDLLQVATSQRRSRKRPVVFIADVSGSMERYSEMLLYFAHAARGRLGPLEAFVFSTRLTRITRELSRRDPVEAVREVALVVTDWSGGTLIGEAMHRFNRDWSRRVTRGGPITIIVSDGWDRGDPELLAEEMARLRRSVHRVVWLNPLAGREGFSPETRGMRAALPYVDDLLSGATLTDLASLVGLLESLPRRRG
jgi:uncharacterized protein with von Willebrand factor type A (vWA) domain